jgi:hypothetical protein
MIFSNRNRKHEDHAIVPSICSTWQEVKSVIKFQTPKHTRHKINQNHPSQYNCVINLAKVAASDAISFFMNAQDDQRFIILYETVTFETDFSGMENENQ